MTSFEQTAKETCQEDDDLRNEQIKIHLLCCLIMMFRSAAVFTKSLNSKLHHRGPTSFAYIFLCSAICIKSSASYAFTRRSVVATMTTSVATGTNSSSQQFWNRELSAKQAFDRKAPVAKEADIICVADPNDAANSDLYQLTERNDGARVLKVGDSVESFSTDSLQGANVLYVSYTPKAREVVSHLLRKIPSIEWIHARSAGIDFITSSELTEWAAKENRLVTNAKGSFSSTLAEYTMLACSYL